MTKTEHYQLPQWESTDQVKMSDFNDAFASIDQKCGNCRIITGSYIGTGTHGRSNPNSIPIPKNPLLVVVQGHTGFFAMPTVERASTIEGGYTQLSSVYLTWGEDSLSWYNDNSSSTQMNMEGYTYNYIIFTIA